MLTIELRGRPYRGGVTGGTLRPELPQVCGRFGVTGNASRRRAFVDVVDVAFFAGDVDMRPIQLERGQAVVKRCAFPTCGIVTGFACRPKRTVMFVVLFMAGITILRRSLVDIIHMARCAGDIHVPALEFECRQIMIELRGSPCGGRVTNSAGDSICATVRVVFLMAGKTIGGSRLKVGHIPRVGVA